MLRRHHQLGHQRGGTLVEALVSMLLLTITFTLAIGSSLNSLRVQAISERMAAYTTATQAIMAKARQADYSDLGFYGNDADAQTGTVTLPVVDRGMLSSIAFDLPTVGALNEGAAQIALRLRRSGAPLPGLTVSGGASGASVAYDQGPGIYSDLATASGPAGVVLLFNVPSSSAGELRTVTLTDGASPPNTYEVDVASAAGAVTYGVIEL